MADAHGSSCCSRIPVIRSAEGNGNSMIYEIQTFADDATQRVIYARVPHRTQQMIDMDVDPPTQYVGASSWQINEQMRQPFQFPIEAVSLEDAFEKWDLFHPAAEKESRRLFAEQQRQAMLMQASRPDASAAAQAILSGRRMR